MASSNGVAAVQRRWSVTTAGADVARDPALAGGAIGFMALHHAGQAAAERVRKSFNGRFQDDCLNKHLFSSLAAARRIIEAWRVDYDTERPHTSLDGSPQLP
jgi:Integrase core domain